MFTGIIEEVGTLTNITDLGGGRRLTVRASFAPDLRVDQSVAINGACQTVVGIASDTFDVVAVEETLRKTTFGSFASGQRVNLERAMLPTSRLDGHLVQGHVDTTATVVDVQQETTNWLVRVRFAAAYAANVIPVGSVALDGISLTVARLDANELTVAIIPHTWEHTTIATWKPGTTINIEFDLIGKYVARALQMKAATSGSKITEAWLREQGW